MKSLYRRLAKTFERTAELAEQGAERHRRKRNHTAVATELEHREKAQEAAERARRLASGR